MKHSDFKIGLEFYCSGGVFRCTDIGTRTIVAIRYTSKDKLWYEGPPYMVKEHVFDENDFEGCTYDKVT